MNGFEEAKSKRNWLERLGEKIPGLRGFRDRELRRDVDRMQREQLAKEIGTLKTRARRLAQDYTDEGRIGALDLFDRLDRRLDGFSQAVRFADYGFTGIFDAEKISEAELEKLYAFDLSFLDEIEALGGDLASIPPPGAENPAAALDRALNRLGALQERWAGRKNVISDVVRASG